MAGVEGTMPTSNDPPDKRQLAGRGCANPANRKRKQKMKKIGNTAIWSLTLAVFLAGGCNASPDKSAGTA